MLFSISTQSFSQLTRVVCITCTKVAYNITLYAIIKSRRKHHKNKLNNLDESADLCNFAQEKAFKQPKPVPINNYFRKDRLNE